MVTITPWPIVSYVMRRRPTPTQPRGMGDAGTANDPAQYFDCPASIVEIVKVANPTILRLAVLSYEPFDDTVEEFDPLAPRFRTFKRIGPTLLTETFAIDPPPIAAGARLVPAPFAVPGAQLGDICHASYDHDLQGMILDASVSSPGFARVVVDNGTTGTVNLAAGNLKITVWRS